MCALEGGTKDDEKRLGTGMCDDMPMQLGTDIMTSLSLSIHLQDALAQLLIHAREGNGGIE